MAELLLEHCLLLWVVLLLLPLLRAHTGLLRAQTRLLLLYYPLRAGTGLLCVIPALLLLLPHPRLLLLGTHHQLLRLLRTHHQLLRLLGRSGGLLDGRHPGLLLLLHR